MQEKDAFANQLAENICRYIDDLARTDDLEVTLHHLDAAALPCWYRFLPYNMHYNIYCLCIKESSDAWNHCIQCQKKVQDRAARQGAYSGICWAGCQEIIFPIQRLDGETVAFLSIGGYAAPRDLVLPRLTRASRDFGLNVQKLTEGYASLNPVVPDWEFLNRKIFPLQSMITLLMERYRLLTEAQETTGHSVSQYEQLISHISRYFPQKLTLSYLSKQFHCSYSCVSHLFRQFGHETFTQILKHIRVDAAKKYLEYTSQSIMEIASNCGFDDPNYFSSVFRKETGMSPTRWRQVNTKLHR